MTRDIEMFFYTYTDRLQGYVAGTTAEGIGVISKFTPGETTVQGITQTLGTFSGDSFTPNPAYDPNLRPSAPTIARDNATFNGRWAQWVPNTISHHLALGTGRRKLSPTYLGGVPWPANASSVGSLPFWLPMWLATAD